jgi:thiol-disulfide isomerase/thioredoxin
MSQQFNELINSERPVLIDFFATWCGPCKVQSSVLNTVKDNVGDAARIVKINTDNMEIEMMTTAFENDNITVACHDLKIKLAKNFPALYPDLYAEISKMHCFDGFEEYNRRKQNENIHNRASWRLLLLFIS